MAQEIERKFLLRSDAWRAQVSSAQRMSQGYLQRGADSAIRVRIAGNHAWLNIKKSLDGIHRLEYEYAIPLQDAEEMLEQVALRPIIDPDFNKSIVDLGFIKNLKIDGGRVAFAIELTTPACPVKAEFERAARERVSALPGVTEVEVEMTSNTRKSVSQLPDADVLPGVRNPIAGASGKGGVGKSTTAVNLARALQATGATVGLMDADVYGPSQGTMFGLDQRAEADENQRLIPLEAHGVSIRSMGPHTTKEAPVIGRGAVGSRLIQPFLSGVVWGELDYLIIDLPPGTGDVQLTLTQGVPLTGAVIVTTPQYVARTIAEKIVEACAATGTRFIFKASYDKANRSSISTKRGLVMEEGLKILSTPASHAFIAGRISPSVWSALNKVTSCWIRVISEERGMVSSGRQVRGEVYPLLAEHISVVGLRDYIDTLSEISQTAFIETRVLLAHRRTWPSESDRFNSDLGIAGNIVDPWLNELTSSSREAPIPIILGGHGLLSGDMLALAEILSFKGEQPEYI